MKKKAAFGDVVLWTSAAACAAGAIYTLATKPLVQPYTLRVFEAALLSGAFLFLARKLSASAKETVAIVLVSLVCALYTAETYFTFATSGPTEAKRSATHDSRSMREVVSDLRNKGDVRAVPIIYPSYLITRPDLFAGKDLVIDGQQVLPLSALSSRTTVLCNESGYWAQYVSDEFGFRNPHGTWSQPIDIAVVGDSFSNGNCVNDGDDWISRVRNSVPRTLNLGMGGNGPLYELATIKEYLTPLKPKIVMWQYFEANETRIPAEQTLPVLRRYFSEPNFRQDLASKQKAIDALLEPIIERAFGNPPALPADSKLRFGEFARLSKLRARLRPGEKGDNPSLTTLSQVLTEAKRVVNGWGGTMYFVYLPSGLGLSSETPPYWYASRAEVVDTAKRAGLRVIDLYPVFASGGDPLSFFPYRGPYHYNPAGYRIVAETVLERLRQDEAAARVMPDAK